MTHCKNEIMCRNQQTDRLSMHESYTENYINIVVSWNTCSAYVREIASISHIQTGGWNDERKEPNVIYKINSNSEKRYIGQNKYPPLGLREYQQAIKCHNMICDTLSLPAERVFVSQNQINFTLCDELKVLVRSCNLCKQASLEWDIFLSVIFKENFFILQLFSVEKKDYGSQISRIIIAYLFSDLMLFSSTPCLFGSMYWWVPSYVEIVVEC